MTCVVRDSGDVILEKYVDQTQIEPEIDPLAAASDVTHAHFCVSPELELSIESDPEWHREDLRDVYLDTDAQDLGQANSWFRVRNGSCVALKRISTDNNNITTYREYPVKRFKKALLPFVALIIKIVRFRNRQHPNVWVDFCEMSDGTEQILYDCVATVNDGSPDAIVSDVPRSGVAFEGFRFFYPKLFSKLKSSTDITQPSSPRSRQPEKWPRWKSPVKILKGEALALALKISENALEDDTRDEK